MSRTRSAMQEKKKCPGLIEMWFFVLFYFCLSLWLIICGFVAVVAFVVFVVGFSLGLVWFRLGLV